MPPWPPRSTAAADWHRAIAFEAALGPKLRPKAVVLADNIYTFKKTLRPYVEYMQSGEHGFVSTTLDISDGFEMSVFTG